MSELKPCPFCGNDRNIALTNEKHDHSGGYFIACPECDASTGLRYAMGDDPRPLLIEAWNRRAQPTQAVPLTTEQVMEIANAHVSFGWLDDYVTGIESVVRAVEKAHGIVGKEGA